MNKKKILIILAIVGAAVIAVVIAAGLLGEVSKRSSVGVMDEAGISPMAGFERGTMMKSAPSPSEQAVESSTSETEASDKKVIKSGDMTLKVADADKAAVQIGEVAKANGGDIFSTNLYEGANNVKSGTVTVKVPVANFEKTFADLKKVASLVVRESISGQDVTEQYTDLQSRLKNKQAEEQAFAAILQRSGGIDDVLKVTRELARVRGEIEVLQGRIKLLESQTDMSTITAQISEDTKITITDKWRPLQVAKDALNNLFRDIQKFVNFTIVLLIRVIPVILVYLVFIWIIYWIGRKIYRKIKNRHEPGT